MAMTDRPALSKGEMEVVRVLWALQRASVREVHEAFPANRQIDFTTVQTYLRRLEAKGYVSGRISGRTRIYSPKVQPRRVIRQTIDDLVERLFGGETLPLMRHLIEDHGVSPRELAELRELIARMEGEKERDSGK
jgi:BlaI family transcriptional regulator, penicillinase repressor